MCYMAGPIAVKTVLDDQHKRRMEAAVADQEAEMARLQQKQLDAESAQRSQVDALRIQESDQLAEIKGMRDAAGTVSASLRALANAPTTKAPTAQQTRKAGGSTARATSTTSGLRIGSSSVGSGVGVNLGG